MIVYVCSKIFVGLPFFPEKTLFRVLCQVSLRLIDGSSKKAVALRLRPSVNTCQYIYCKKLYFFIKSEIQAKLVIFNVFSKRVVLIRILKSLKIMSLRNFEYKYAASI